MRLPSLFGTSSFRLALIHAGTAAVTFSVLFGVIFWSTARFMRHQIDDSVTSEVEEIIADAAKPGALPAHSIVQSLSEHPSSGFFYVLQDAQGRVLAGNLPAVDPLIGIREWGGRAKHRHDPYSGLRGRGALLEGDYLFVGWSTYQLHEMDEFIAEAFAGGVLVSTLIALLSGALTGHRLLKHIDRISATTRQIIDGDLTQRVPVQHGGDELDTLSRNINAMLDRIQTLMDDLRQVSVDIAHDLRTPLTRLRNRLEFAQRSGADADALSEVLDATRHDTDVILEIFSALLRIAQIESGGRKSAFAVTLLSEVMATVAEVYRSAADEKGQTIQEHIDTPLYIRGDRELLMQLFANLVENAIRHSPQAACLRIDAHAVADEVTVVIADSGPGIPADLRGKVLQRFFRLERSRTTAGSGLGLSLAAAVAQLHDTELVLSDNQPGLRVTVNFPRARPP